jgi:hypothetical protein
MTRIIVALVAAAMSIDSSGFGTLQNCLNCPKLPQFVYK